MIVTVSMPSARRNDEDRRDRHVAAEHGGNIHRQRGGDRAWRKAQNVQDPAPNRRITVMVVAIAVTAATRLPKPSSGR